MARDGELQVERRSSHLSGDLFSPRSPPRGVPAYAATAAGLAAPAA
jgi:hypothetical protein